MASAPLDPKLDEAYRSVLQRIRLQLGEATQRTEAVMKAAPGWQGAAKAAAAQCLLETLRAECEPGIDRLVDAHRDGGARSADEVTRQVADRFLAELKAPGLVFFPDSGPDASALLPLALRHAADFESLKERWKARAAERFRAPADDRTLPASVIETVPAAAPPVAPRRTPGGRLVYGWLVLTAVLSLAGVSWLGLLRNLLGW